MNPIEAVAVKKPSGDDWSTAYGGAYRSQNNGLKIVDQNKFLISAGCLRNYLLRILRLCLYIL